MITAELIPGGAGLFASFSHETGKVVAFEKVLDAAEAERRMYFHNRNYIAETMISWLKQRKYAMELIQSPDVGKTVYLIQGLREIRLGTFRTIEKYIRDNMPLFQLCAPIKPGTKQFKYYENEVRPVLEFCSGNKNG